MKDKILELRSQGKSYRQIQLELGCSKSTISFHLGDGQKIKTADRMKKYRKVAISRKIERFRTKKTKNLIESVRRFQKRYSAEYSAFSAKDVIEKFGEQTHCYLSGHPIDLFGKHPYNLDHIIPASRGGNNSIDNLGIIHPKVNQMKSDLTIQEMFQWMIKILEYNGFSVKRPEALKMQ